MRNFIIVFCAAMIFAACGNQPSVNVTNNNSNESLTVSSHSGNATPTVVPKSETTTKWTQSGNPIDTKQFDADIAAAEKTEKAKPNDGAAKKSLAVAYIKRGIALTEARQYASALGDYRRALKFDPANEEAKKWIDQIIAIYDSINRTYPNEGEEPPPLPFGEKSGTDKTADSGAERIEFKSGATEAAAKGNLKNFDDKKTFVIKVNAGQVIRTEQIKPENSLKYITVDITDPSGETVGNSDASCNNRKEITPTVAGDYKIEVVECKKADPWSGGFDLNISVK